MSTEAERARWRDESPSIYATYPQIAVGRIHALLTDVERLTEAVDGHLSMKWPEEAHRLQQRALEFERDRNHAQARAERATGLLDDLVTAKRLRLDAEEWQLIWDRVNVFLNDGAQ